MDYLPIDIASILREELLEGQRPPDGKLHPSTDMFDLRHSQLRYAGFMEKPRSTASMVRLETGTMWHERLHAALKKRGIPVMTEVNLEPWLPEGWAGTADWLIFDPVEQAWVLGDIKTTTGTGLSYRRTEGMDGRHWLQLSAYWAAASRMGIPLLNKVCVIYVPLDDSGDGGDVYVSVDEPGDVEEIDAQMDFILKRCREFSPPGEDDVYLTELEPQLDRVQKVTWNGKRSAFELKLTPHWLTRYCDFGEVCGCSEQGETKIGEFTWADGELVYSPRKGFDDIEPEVSPHPGDVRKRYS